jgi:hypothetical protein
MSLGIREMRSDLHRLAAGQVSTFPAGHASQCVQMPAFQLKRPRWQGKSKLTTLEIGALQSGGGGGGELATRSAPQLMQGASIKKNHHLKDCLCIFSGTLRAWCVYSFVKKL